MGITRQTNVIFRQSSCHTPRSQRRQPTKRAPCLQGCQNQPVNWPGASSTSTCLVSLCSRTVHLEHTFRPGNRGIGSLPLVPSSGTSMPYTDTSLQLVSVPAKPRSPCLRELLCVRRRGLSGNLHFFRLLRWTSCDYQKAAYGNCSLLNDEEQVTRMLSRRCGLDEIGVCCLVMYPKRRGARENHRVRMGMGLEPMAGRGVS